MDKAYEMFQKKLKSHQAFIGSTCDQITPIFIADDVNQKVSIVQSLIHACTKLRDLCDPDTPAWVIRLLAVSTQFIQNRNDIATRNALISLISGIRSEISLYDWNLGGYQSDYNFEEIYKKYKTESRLPELFDELISLIENILNDQEIELADSEKKIKLLLTIIRSNNKKSLFADQSILNYLIFFIKEFLLNLSQNIPGLREFIEALITTAEKIKDEIEVTRRKTEDEIKSKTKVDLLVSYNSAGIIKELNDAYQSKVDLLT